MGLIQWGDIHINVIWLEYKDRDSFVWLFVEV